MLTLNRPEVMNSLNFALLHALAGEIEAVRFRADVRVLVVTGAGEKASVPVRTSRSGRA